VTCCWPSIVVIDRALWLYTAEHCILVVVVVVLVVLVLVLVHDGIR